MIMDMAADEDADAELDAVVEADMVMGEVEESIFISSAITAGQLVASIVIVDSPVADPTVKTKYP